MWCNSLAGLGTFGLELRVLSRETGDPRFRAAAEKIHAEVDRRWRRAALEASMGSLQPPPTEQRLPRSDVSDAGPPAVNRNGFHQKSFFLPPASDHAWALPWMRWAGLASDAAETFATNPASSAYDCESGGDRVGFGSGGDSYYEYLLKESLVEHDPAARLRLVDRYKAMLATALQEDSPVLSGRLRPAAAGIAVGAEGAETENVAVSAVKYDRPTHHQHLSCFAGGMFALGASALGVATRNDQQVESG